MGRVAGMTAADTRDRLIEAAAEVFAEQGYEGTRTSEIARRAGLSTGAIYSQYGTKAELLLEAIRANAPIDLERLLQGDLGGRSLPDILGALGACLPARPEAIGASMLEAVAAGRRDPKVAEVLAGAAVEREEILSRLVAISQRAGQVDAGLPPDALARFCLTLVFGTVVAQSIGLTPPDPGDWALVIARLIDSIRPTPEEQP